MGVNELVFLGTGGDAFVVGKQLRGSGGFVVKTEGCQLHIDPGPGALSSSIACGINPRETTAVLVSHAHTNHCNDVNAIVSAMTHNGLDARGVLVANASVLDGCEGIPARVTEFYKKCVERIIVAEPGKRIGIEDVEIVPFSANHDEPKSLGFKILAPKYTLGYTSDTYYSKELADSLKKCDILVVNSVYPFKSKEELLGSDDVVRLLKRVNPKLCVITHFGHKMHNANPVYEAREIKKQTEIPVIAATDGLVLDPITYSATSSQLRLKQYSPGQEQPDSQ